MYNLPTYKTPPSRGFARESRPYDFLYDSTYTVPSRADFLASLKYGTRSGAQQKIRPVFNTMFSAVKTDTRNVACLARRTPDVIDNFVHQYDVNGVPIIPADTGPLPVRLVDEVTGANRHKYAIRYGQPSYKLDMTEKNTEEFRRSNDLRLQFDGKRTSTKSIQTDYRDSECQTDPYSPPYFLPYAGAYPQLLSLVKLTWEKGLPFSLDDIVIIERALSKRVLEYVDRAVEDEKDFEDRIKLMEELEAQQWADREKELEKISQRKLELTNRLLQEYASRVANEHTLRLERLHTQLKTKSNDQFQNIKHQYFRDLRKLERKYIHKKATRQRDIVRDYTEFDSGIYAPLTRNGAGVDNIGDEPTEFSWNINDFDKIDAITKEPSFIKHELTFDVDRFKEKIEKCKPTGTTKRLEKKLEDIYLSFKDHGMKSKDPLNFMGQLDGHEHGKRPTTPEIITEENLEMEWRKPHVVLLQKIARGRTIQKLIREEMEKNMSEILGLKRMYDMDPNCQHLEEGRFQKLMAMKKESEANDTADTPVDEVVGHLEGETLTKMVDFLDKEMIRLIDERKIHALILLAERERKLKEASEGGRRFKEEEARRANDEIFKQITGIHQATVDMYLEEIFLESCDRVADDQSRVYVQKLASTLNDALLTTGQMTLSDFEQEELAADLVSGFMIPELHRISHNSRIEAAGPRYKKAAEQVLDAVFSAHPATMDIIEDVEPVVEEHLQRSIAAFDGGIEVVGDVITDAVNFALWSEAQATAADAKNLDELSRTISTKTTDGSPQSSQLKSDSSSDPKSDKFPEPKVKFDTGGSSLDSSKPQPDSEESSKPPQESEESSKPQDFEEDAEPHPVSEESSKALKSSLDSDRTFSKISPEVDPISVDATLASLVDQERLKAEEETEEKAEEKAEETAEEKAEEKAEETVAPDESKVETEETEVKEEIDTAAQLTDVREKEDLSEVKAVEGQEVLDSDEPHSMPSQKFTVQISDDVIRRMAGKSVQVMYDTEIGQHVESVFSGANYTIDNLFDDVKQKVGSPRTDDSGSDATLSDDTDD